MREKRIAVPCPTEETEQIQLFEWVREEIVSYLEGKIQ